MLISSFVFIQLDLLEALCPSHKTGKALWFPKNYNNPPTPNHPTLTLMQPPSFHQHLYIKLFMRFCVGLRIYFYYSSGSVRRGRIEHASLPSFQWPVSTPREGAKLLRLEWGNLTTRRVWHTRSCLMCACMLFCYTYEYVGVASLAHRWDLGLMRIYAHISQLYLCTLSALTWHNNRPGIMHGYTGWFTIVAEGFLWLMFSVRNKNVIEYESVTQKTVESILQNAKKLQHARVSWHGRYPSSIRFSLHVFSKTLQFNCFDRSKDF